MSTWSEYVEWSGLDESRLAHPAGKGIPESPEVAQSRMDAEAVDLANGGDCDGWLQVAWAVIALIGLHLLVVTSAVIGEMVAGWPL